MNLHSTRRLSWCWLLTAVFLIAGTLQLSAAEGDWGVTVDLEATGRVEEDEWSDAETTFSLNTALWTRTLLPTPDRPGATLELATQLGYLYTDDRPYLFDVDLFRLRGVYPTLIAGRAGLLEQTFGRYRFSDPSGRVLSHLADGFGMGVRYPSWNLNFGFSTTAFQLNPSSSIRMTDADVADADDSDLRFGPGRGIGMIELGIPELLGAHGLRVGLTAQTDLRSPELDDETIDSVYYTLVLAGPVVGALYYDLNATLMQARSTVGTEEEDTLGVQAGARLRYFAEQFLSSRAVLSVLYASGDKDDNISRFRPISRGSAGTVFTEKIEDLVVTELGFSLRPFSAMGNGAAAGIQTGVNWKSFFKATELTADDTANLGVLEPGEGQWYGNEIMLSISARIFADLGIGLSGGVFLPITSEDLGVFGKDAEAEYFGRFEISTGF